MDIIYRYLYVTTNLVNGKQYIGQHTTTNLDDGYLGSGTVFKKAVEKYGKENFSKQIVKFADSAEELNALEKECIQVFNAVESDDYYNLAEGGITPGKLSYRTPEETKQLMREIALKRFANKENHPCYGKKPSKETKERQRKAKEGMYFGEDNPNYGKRWSEELRKRVGQKRKGEFAGGKNPRAKAVVCVETGVEYGCSTEAAAAYHCDRHWIIDCCNNKRETAGGVHWKYASRSMLIPCQDSQE